MRVAKRNRIIVWVSICLSGLELNNGRHVSVFRLRQKTDAWTHALKRRGHAGVLNRAT